MKTPYIRNLVTFFICLFCFSLSSYANLQCIDKNFTLQVLGSGGPIPEGSRASSGYLIWWDGKAKFLIDTGGGTFLRFGQAGAAIEDLDMISLTHFHTDHAADLPAILKGGYFSDRTHSLKISGPSGNTSFPGMQQFLYRLFDAKQGAFAYLSGYLDGTDGLFKLDPIEINYTTAESHIIYKDDIFTVTALGVPHSIVPALAYRFDTPHGSVVISSDQSGKNANFIQFSKDADMLVMPMAIPEDSSEMDKTLHAPPSVLGNIAKTAEVKSLILTHFMGPTARFMQENIDVIQKGYKGPVFAARDLECFPFAKK